MTFGRLLLIFILVPIVELILLVRLGGLIGLLPTIGLVLLTGFVGAALARAEGLRVLARFQGELAGGKLPGQALFDAISVLIGGAFLLTPGVLTDLLGFALLLPVSRRWIQRHVRRQLERGIERGTIRVMTSGGMGGFGASSGFGRPGSGGVGFGGGPEGRDRRPDEDLPDLDPRHGIEVPPDDS